MPTASAGDTGRVASAARSMAAPKMQAAQAKINFVRAWIRIGKRGFARAGTGD
ncbi:MAG: hypothetical protein ACK4Q5_04230 [Saprospiraceae bacterium]